MSVYRTNQKIELFRTQQKKKNQKQSFKKILKTTVPMQNKNPFPQKKASSKKSQKSFHEGLQLAYIHIFKFYSFI